MINDAPPTSYNQVIGHYTANGIAPLPRSRQELVLSNTAQARELIGNGR